MKLRILKIIGELFNNAAIDKPEFSIFGISRIKNVFWCKNDPLDDVSDVL